MSNWFIRAHMSALDLSNNLFFDYIANRSEVLVCVEHPPDSGCSRVHCHIYAESCKVKYDSISDRLTKIGVPKGNEGRSIKDTYEDASKNKVPVNRGTITYMSKGIYNPSYLKGITMEEYNEFSSKWIVHGSQEKKKKEKEKKEKKKTERDIYFSILETLEKVPYKCGCFLCSPCASNGYTQFEYEPRFWDATEGHENTKYAMTVIRNEYMKHSYYDERKMMRVMYMLVNHKDIHEKSVSRMEKFLYG